MRVRHGVIGVVAAVAATVALAGSGEATSAVNHSFAPVAPASVVKPLDSVQWGTFTLDTPYWNALEFTAGRLAQDPAWGHYSVFDDGNSGNNDYTVQAWQPSLNVNVTVVCVPVAAHTTWVSVIATGPNSSWDEQERNNIRAQIINLHLD